MEDTSSSNTTFSHIYVALEQISFYVEPISFYEENQETETEEISNRPNYKLEISCFWISSFSMLSSATVSLSLSSERFSMCVMEN